MTLITDSDERAGEPFVARWSRRKVEAREPGIEAAETAPVANHESAISADGATLQDRSAELPPLEALDAESDFSGFLSPEVDEALRRAALRKLFHLAEFNVLDGLNDYDEDYTVFAPLGDMVPHTLARQRQMEEAEQAARAVENDASRPEAESQRAEEDEPPSARGDVVTVTGQADHGLEPEEEGA